jgi:hypothetical protein
MTTNKITEQEYLNAIKMIDGYSKMLFFCIIGIKGVFFYYYSKSNEFKGNYPDTIEEFIDRCMKDTKFCRKWFSMCYDELKHL